MRKEKSCDDFHILAIVDNLVDVHRDSNQPERAETLYKHNLSIGVQSWGTEHPKTTEAMTEAARLTRDTTTVWTKPGFL